MERLETIEAMIGWRAGEAGRVGFVPTMGALHEGHLSLVRLALKHADPVVVSIFVNPTQFGPGEDFETYPRDLDGDLEKLRQLGVSAVFTPTEEDLYPPGYETHLRQESLTSRLCGAHRPGHFQGVLTIVCKLFNLVRPHLAVFGQKDYQQTVVLQQMIVDLHFDVEMLVAPIVREPDGLALSSRNAYLSETERERALALNRALTRAEEAFKDGTRSAEELRTVLRSELDRGKPDRVDYAEIVHPGTLEPIDPIPEGAVALIAAHIGDTRLIDNRILTVD